MTRCFAITSSTVDKDGAVVVCHLVLAAHDVAQRTDGGLIVGLLQLVDVGWFSVGVVVPMLHHGLDEHRHDDVLGFIVLDECNGRVGLASVVGVEGFVEAFEEGLRGKFLLVGEGTVAELYRIEWTEQTKIELSTKTSIDGIGTLNRPRRSGK